MIRSGPLARFRDAPGFDKLLNAAQTRADAGHTAVSLMANDKAMTRFALSLEHFVARRGWRNGVPEDHLLWLAEPVAGFAARSLDRLHRKLRKRGRHFGSLTPEARHALRIKLKQMRYATEFFGRLFHPSSAAERYGHRAAALQDLLGQVNDATIGLRLMKELDFGADAEFAYAAGVAAGWCGRGSLGDKPALREAWRPILRADREARTQICLDFREPARSRSARVHPRRSRRPSAFGRLRSGPEEAQRRSVPDVASCYRGLNLS